MLNNRYLYECKWNRDEYMCLHNLMGIWVQIFCWSAALYRFLSLWCLGLFFSSSTQSDVIHYVVSLASDWLSHWKCQDTNTTTHVICNLVGYLLLSWFTLGRSFWSKFFWVYEIQSHLRLKSQKTIMVEAFLAGSPKKQLGLTLKLDNGES